MIAIDTNLLVYAHRSGVAEHRRARRAIERACAHDGGWGVAYPCLLEFWSVVTHPRADPQPSTPQEAEAFLRSLVETGAMELWLPGPGFSQRLLQTAVGLKVSGPRIFDLQIALMSFEHGAGELWTHDSEFLVFPGQKRHDPLGG